MQSWIRKKLGITPELEAKVENIERIVTARSETLPFAVNRQVLVLLPLEKYFAWKYQWESHGKVPPAQPDPIRDRWLNARAYLVSGIDDSSKLANLVKRHRKYFLNSYVEGHSPKNRWPWVPREEEFAEWFEVQLIGWGAWDLETGELSKMPDILIALGPEL